ncbi:DUF4185 domain-containing protein [Nocardioides sp. URHA0020]|uniref:DUF4185 domain-containing protein n=1 Tax=Nocardioides sp. URHA0020 TaxID=1380392 RepID=UPI00048F9B3E|nr:DUF4185 domain-containing protein [Nocardioides sp. URHA0020]
MPYGSQSQRRRAPYANRVGGRAVLRAIAAAALLGVTVAPVNAVPVVPASLSGVAESPARQAVAARTSRCTDPAPTTAAGYQRMFDAKNDWTWSGGDQGSTVPLPDGRVVWLFADTLLGRQTSSGRRAANTRMIHSSLVIQDRGCLTGVTGRRGGSVIPEPTPTSWYWPQQGVIDGGKLVIFAIRATQAAGPGAFGFRTVGVDAAVFSLPKTRAEVPTYQRMAGTPASRSGTAGILWGVSLTSDARYHYVYGTRWTAHYLGKAVYVARVPHGRLARPSAWQYWTGSSWAARRPAAARPVVSAAHDSWSTSFSASRTSSGYEFVTKAGDVYGADVVKVRASSPVGPFSSTTVNNSAPSTSTVLQYNPLGHPELPVRGGYLGHISRNLNSTSTAAINKDADQYKPQFFVVTP